LLNQYGLSRSSKLGIGKQIGHHVWLHKHYIKFLNKYVSALPPVELNISTYDVVKFDLKTHDISFIQCDDFNCESEPSILMIISYKYLNGKYIFHSKKCYRNRENKQIYHHKWLFVLDDFFGFNVEESKKRSIHWKGILGNNKTVSSKIGYSKFWKQWLKENNME
jgi:hypothetical protein